MVSLTVAAFRPQLNKVYSAGDASSAYALELTEDLECSATLTASLQNPVEIER